MLGGRRLTPLLAASIIYHKTINKSLVLFLFLITFAQFLTSSQKPLLFSEFASILIINLESLILKVFRFHWGTAIPYKNIFDRHFV